jgi:hypothetical protein
MCIDRSRDISQQDALDLINLTSSCLYMGTQINQLMSIVEVIDRMSPATSVSSSTASLRDLLVKYRIEHEKTLDALRKYVTSRE